MNKVRPLKHSEIAELATWAAQLPLLERYGASPSGLADQFAQALEQGERLLAIENTEGNVCGVAWIMPRGAFGRSPYLRFIGIHPDCSGAGLGSMLLDVAETQAASQGHELFLLVSDFNTRAQQFYQRHGYTQVGAIPDYVVPGITELVFWKQL